MASTPTVNVKKRLASEEGRPKRYLLECTHEKVTHQTLEPGTPVHCKQCLASAA